MTLIGKTHVYNLFIIHLTSLFGCHLAGNTGDVTVKARPAGLTLAAVGGDLLPAGSSVLTGGQVAPAHQVLKGAGEKLDLKPLITDSHSFKTVYIFEFKHENKV